MKRNIRMGLLLIALPLAGCSDDDPTGPVDQPEPRSRLYQVAALADGSAYAVGVEGASGRLYSNASGAWGPVADPGPAGDGTPTGVLPVSADELFLYVSAKSTVERYVDEEWASEELGGGVEGEARLFRSSGSLFLLDTGGGPALRRQGEAWELLYDFEVQPSLPRAVVRSGEGDSFVAFERPQEGMSLVVRVTDAAAEVEGFSGRLVALAAAGGDTVWGAGDQLARYAGGGWTHVSALPDTQTVTAIGVAAPGVLTLVCESGVIYRWQADTYSVLQEFELREPLASVAYVRDDLIYGTLNYVDDSTGHEVGIVVRYDGTQWIPDFLAPPALP